MKENVSFKWKQHVETYRLGFLNQWTSTSIKQGIWH